jgi:hypothetical protein
MTWPGLSAWDPDRAASASPSALMSWPGCWGVDNNLTPISPPGPGAIGPLQGAGGRRGLPGPARLLGLEIPWGGPTLRVCSPSRDYAPVLFSSSRPRRARGLPHRALRYLAPFIGAFASLVLPRSGSAGSWSPRRLMGLGLWLMLAERHDTCIPNEASRIRIRTARRTPHYHDHEEAPTGDTPIGTPSGSDPKPCSLAGLHHRTVTGLEGRQGERPGRHS